MIDWSAHPIEAGMGGDPWLIAVCVMVRYKASAKAARQVLPALLERWPRPVDLAAAPVIEVAAALGGLAFHHRKARTLKRIARAILVGPGSILFNRTILEALRRYGR